MTRSSNTHSRSLPTAVAAVVSAAVAASLVSLSAHPAAAVTASPSPAPSTSTSTQPDATPPTWSVAPSVRVPVGGVLTVVFSEPVSGVDASSVTVHGTPAAVGVSGDGRSALVRPLSLLLPGASHSVSVSSAVRDSTGNAVAAGERSFTVDHVVDDRSPALGYGGLWRPLAATDAVAGTFSRSTPSRTRQTAATVALFGRGAEVRGCVGPSQGVVEVWADGVRRTRIDTYRSYSGCGVVLTRVPFTTGTGAHRVQVRGVGAKNVRSTGTAVSIDAVVAVR